MDSWLCNRLMWGLGEGREEETFSPFKIELENSAFRHHFKVGVGIWFKINFTTK